MAGPYSFLYDYQARVLRALARGGHERPGATFTVLFPRQGGKNEVQSVLVASLLVTHADRGGTVVVCAPTRQPQALLSLSRIRSTYRAVQRLTPRADVRITAEGITVGRASAVYLGASPEANVAGHTASLALIADEAQDIDEAWFDRQFRPMAAWRAAPTVLFGTPWDGRNLLDRAVARNRLADLRAGPKTLRLHHQVSWYEIARVNPAYGDHVRSERQRLGPTHVNFRTQYELETVEQEGRLFDTATLAGIEGDHPRLASPAPGERYVAGLDLADGGADSSVLTIARLTGERIEVVEHVTWTSTAIEVESAAIEVAKAWRVERLVVDATGIGRSVADRMALALPPGVVEAFGFTAASKTALGYGLLAAAGRGSLRLSADATPGNRVLRHELEHCTAAFLGAGSLRWEAAPGTHDDYVVSLALCVRAAELAGPERMARGHRRP